MDSSTDQNHIEPSIGQIYIDSGNLLRVEEVKRQATLLPDEEVVTGLSIAVNAWRNKKINHVVKDSKLIISKFSGEDKIDPTTRENCKITIKLFIYSDICTLLEDALDFALEMLNTDYLDSLIIAIQSSDGTKLPMDKIKSIWKCTEKIGINKVKDFGMSDLDTDQLAELYQSAKQIKPSSNQINLESCCVIPPEMRDFAQNNNIKLLTHNDPRDFLSTEKFNQIISCCGIEDVQNWSRFWIARYTILQKHKGIVQNKGYIL